MIKIKKYAVWKGNRIIKLSDDKGELAGFIKNSSPEERDKMLLAKRSGVTWISEPLHGV